MAVAKLNIPVSGTATTNVAATWVTVAQCDVPVTDGTFILTDIFLLPKGPTNLTQIQGGQFKGEHRGRIVGGTISMINTLTNIVSFFAAGAGTFFGNAQARINQSGSTLLLQVQPNTTTLTDWYGGFTLIVN